jgi:hypothetical protein
LAALAVSSLLAGVALGGAPWYEGFEGPKPSWRDAGGNARYRIARHERVRNAPHTGEGCEWVQVVGEGGTAVYVSHEVGHPRVIEDLAPTVWIKADRPGIQLAVQVVLPRSPDSRTGQPLSATLLGASYTQVGRWQQLRIDEIPKLLARQVRVLRAQFGANVDGQDAYVDAVLLNVFGGPGTTNVWIDDLDIAGHVAYENVAIASQLQATAPLRAATQPSARRVQLSGSVLLADGRPLFPRAVQHRGEPLAALRRMGFNTVWTDRPATGPLLDEAAAAGVWLVCPPPPTTRIDLGDEPTAVVAEFGPEYGCVLCWDMGQGLGEAEVEGTRRWADQVRSGDRKGGRPLICRADRELRAYSRACDLLLLDRRPIGSSLELGDYAAWVREQPRLARPGTPVWTTVQTQLAAAVREQLRALDPARPPPSVVAPEQLRLLVYYAVAAGSRGVLMLSDSPLTAEDPETRDRAAALELLNLELELLEPWGAAGGFVANVEASESQVVGAVLRTERARLLMPIWSSPGAQFVPGQSAANAVTLTVPGVPEAISAYELTPGGIQPLRHKRVTGGTRVTLDEFGLSDLVLLAQDPLIVNALAQRSTAIGRRAADLQRQLAGRKLQGVQDVLAQLAGTVPISVAGGPRNGPVPFTPPAQTQEWLAAARRNLQRCDGWLATKNYPAAYAEAGRAMRALRLVERSLWELLAAGLSSPVASPGATGFATLPWHTRLSDRINASRLGPNLLAGGDLEDVVALERGGWQNVQRPAEDVAVTVDLAPVAAHSGGRGLRLTARPVAPNAAPAVVESPPVWVTTGAAPVEAGQLVCISGWVQLPGGFRGSVDGLLVGDSLGGEPLAARIAKTNGWQRFALYRVAPQSGPLSVTFALTGLGEAWLDDLAIQPLQPAEVKRAER